jgi:hypothetical protein
MAIGTRFAFGADVQPLGRAIHPQKRLVRPDADATIPIKGTV